MCVFVCARVCRRHKSECSCYFRLPRGEVLHTQAAQQCDMYTSMPGDVYTCLYYTYQSRTTHKHEHTYCIYDLSLSSLELSQTLNKHFDQMMDEAVLKQSSVHSCNYIGNSLLIMVNH